jgi:hypothetical protein
MLSHLGDIMDRTARELLIAVLLFTFACAVLFATSHGLAAVILIALACTIVTAVVLAR